MTRIFPTLCGMEAGSRTWRSLAAATLILLSACVLLPGCAPHRRGPLPALDPTARTEPSPPAREPIIPPPEPAPGRPPVEWSEIDRTQPPADQVCDMAMSFLGTPYVYGGSSPKGFDCSGLVQYVYREVGVDLPRTVQRQSRTGRAATVRTLLRGDLIFFQIDRGVISHVGIYVGRGEFVHAPGTGKHVRVDSIDNGWWRKRVKAVRRIITS